MKKITIKLLLTAVLAANAGSAFAMQPQASPEFVKTFGQIMASAGRLTPSQFEEIKTLINAYPTDQINNASVGPWHRGTILDAVTLINNQFPDERYEELIRILGSVEFLS